MNTKRHTQYWVIPPEADAEFTAHMEDILDVYSRPYNADVPVLCMDEQPVQLVQEVKQPMTASRITTVNRCNKAQEWDAGFSELAAEMEIPLVINRAGTMSGFYFLKSAPQNWQQVQKVDTELFKIFYHAMLDHSVFLAPSPFEAAFYSSAHNADTNRMTLAACRTALEKVRLWTKTR